MKWEEPMMVTPRYNGNIPLVAVKKIACNYEHSRLRKDVELVCRIQEHFYARLQDKKLIRLRVYSDTTL